MRRRRVRSGAAESQVVPQPNLHVLATTNVRQKHGEELWEGDEGRHLARARAFDRASVHYLAVDEDTVDAGRQTLVLGGLRDGHLDAILGQAHAVHFPRKPRVDITASLKAQSV